MLFKFYARSDLSSLITSNFVAFLKDSGIVEKTRPKLRFILGESINPTTNF
jgi:hypothetical protein